MAETAHAAQDGDPLQSEGCLRAMAGLRSQTETADKPGDRALIKLLQQSAARACLSSTADPVTPRSGRLAQTPISVPSVTTASRPPPRTVATPSAIPTRPLQTITGCDALGCWTSSGTRLPRVGPGLQGPRGLCTAHGAVLNCP